MNILVMSLFTKSFLRETFHGSCLHLTNVFSKNAAHSAASARVKAEGRIYHFRYDGPAPNADTQSRGLQTDGSTIWRSWGDGPSYSAKENLTALGTGFQGPPAASHTHQQKPLETGGQAERETQLPPGPRKYVSQLWSQIWFFSKSQPQHPSDPMPPTCSFR